jgi:hypothetical protein
MRHAPLRLKARRPAVAPPILGVVPFRRLRSRGARSLRLALAGVALGCGDNGDEPRQAPCDDPICVADPVPHLVCPDACARDDDCPQGTVCTAPPGEGGLCVPPRGPHATSTALAEGFGVRQMESTLVTVELPSVDGRVEAGAELGWRAPASSVVVTCALLACPPVVQDGAIANYDQCVLARIVSEQVVGSFALTDPEREHPLPETETCVDGSTPVADTSGRFPVTELLVGCWAYDDTRLIAATRLRRPAADQIHDFHDGFDLDCQGQAAAGRTCVLGDGTMGSCASGVCHRRCLRDADCGEGVEPAAEGSCDGEPRVGLLSLCAAPAPVRAPEEL